MASQGANVLRWSALGLGIFYGVYHQRTINSSDKAAVEHNDWSRKEKLIAEAKAQYAKLTAPRNAGSKDAVVTNIEDPRFDLEKLLLKAG